MTEMVPEIIEERPLSVIETKRLSELEGVIEVNFKGFVAVGMALAEISNSRLYRRQFKTFEMYCQNLWEINKTHAYGLIKASEVVQNLSAIADKSESDFRLLPTNEAQARELTKLPPEEQAHVWEQIVNLARNNGEKITAKAVKKGVLSFRNKAIDKQVDKAKKATRENRTDFQSEDFTQAFDQFFEQVRIEKEANWRYTSRKTVFRILQGLVDVVSEAVPGTLKAQGCLMELSDREKLKKGGFRIFRMDVKARLIEEWHHGDSWTLFVECPSPKALNDQFKELMENHTHLKG